MSYIGFFTNLFLIITWLVFRQKRRYPERLVLFFASGIMMVSLHGIIQSSYTRKETTCLNNFVFLEPKHSAFCIVSCIIFIIIFCLYFNLLLLFFTIFLLFFYFLLLFIYF